MKNGKIFNRINIIDFLIIIIAVIFAVGLAVRIIGTRSNGMLDVHRFEYVLKVNDIRDMSVAALKKKGTTYSDKENIVTGEITDVVSEPYMAEIVTENGKRVYAEKPNRYTVYVTVRAEGTMSNGIYYDSEKIEMGVGRGYRLCTRNIVTNGEIVSIKSIDE